MKLGMFSPEIKRCTPKRLFDAIKIYGFDEVQFDFLSVCDEELPKKIDKRLTEKIYKISNDEGINICAINGTFNMIHPDKKIREDGIQRFEQIAIASNILHCPIISLCTGTRNTESMWMRHDDNETQEAWEDLIVTVSKLLSIADKYKVSLGVEVEASNVVNTPEKGRKLLDTMDSKWLGVIFDPANFFHIGKAYPENAFSILEHAFELLGNDIISAHGKDIKSGPGIEFTSAGRGIVEFERFFELLESVNYTRGITLHGMYDESEFPYSVEFTKKLISAR